jgi:hypothetical protein
MPEILSIHVAHNDLLEKSSEEWVPRPIKRTKIVNSDSEPGFLLSSVHMSAECQLVDRTGFKGTSWLASDGIQDEATNGDNDDALLIMGSNALTFASMGRSTKTLITSPNTQLFQAVDIIQRIEAIFI